MAKQGKDTFVLRHDAYPQIKMLTREQRGDLLTAIFAYSTGEDLPDMDVITCMCFGFIKASLDTNAARYDEICQRNAHNGAKGGRPSNKAAGFKDNPSVPAQSDRFSEKPNESDGFDSKPNTNCGNPIDSDSDIESDLDPDSDSVSVSVSESEPRGRERENFLKVLLFEKKLRHPQVELERFEAHYGKTGWVDANGNPIRDRLAALKAWKPDKEAGVFPPETVKMWHKVYDAVQTKCPGVDASVMLTHFCGLVGEGANLVLICQDDTLRQFVGRPEVLKVVYPLLVKILTNRSNLMCRVLESSTAIRCNGKYKN